LAEPIPPARLRGVDEAVDELRVRTLRLATGTHLLSISEPGAVLPSLLQVLEHVPRHEDILLNLEGATRVEAALAHAAIARSRRVRESARPLFVVSDDETLRLLLDWSGLERQVLIEPSLEDALRFFVGSRWLSTFAEVGAYASTSP
jgi:anti-anti-sigma regulatory factor